MTKLTSLQNDLVKRWASLHEQKHRQKERLFLLEGPHLVQEALQTSVGIVAVCSSDRVWLEQVEVPETCQRYEVTPAIVAKCCSTETPQHVFAVAELPETGNEFPWKSIEIAVLLDAIQDPGNLGAILRTAAAVGVDVVILGDGCADVFSPKVLRVAMGASFRMPVIQHPLATVIPKLKAVKCRILASVLHQKATNCFQLALQSPKVAWMVGNEGCGIQASLVSLADTLVTIPMLRQTESLSVPQATAVLLYETFRQKKRW